MEKLLDKNINFLTNDVFSDEKIVKVASMGNEKAQNFLIKKYSSIIPVKFKTYFLVGGDSEDIVQEGMIGIYKAIKNFDLRKSTSFKSFALMCINRQIITAIKHANRKKHFFLNNYVSISVNDKEKTYKNTSVLEEKFLKDTKTNPEDLFIYKENFLFFKKIIEKILSSFEKKIFKLYTIGINYKVIASYFKKSPKSIDNALQRIKKKLIKFNTLETFV